MNRWKQKLSLVFLAVLLLTQCKARYYPPSTGAGNHFLVVDGILVGGQDSTLITLSRTRGLSDTVTQIPELGATVQVLGSGGDSYTLTELGGGTYSSAPLPLNPSEQYQVKIATQSGGQYVSDFVPVQQSPPIDSLSYRADSSGLTLYVNTHDPTGNTKFYLWQYRETWEHRSVYGSYYIYSFGGLKARDSTQQIYRCWTQDFSTSLLLGSTASLSQDIIYQIPLLSIPLGAEQLSYVYSLEVKQYGLTQEGYNYWQNQKKNSEETGTLFDPQPTQVTGNIHSVGKPSEAVIGYLTASSPARLRIFINRSQVSFWPYQPLQGCSLTPVSPGDIPLVFSDTTQWVPINGLLGGAYSGTSTQCGDCTFAGGSTVKPSYWPN
jgi:hypothetical protein